MVGAVEAAHGLHAHKGLQRGLADVHIRYGGSLLGKNTPMAFSPGFSSILRGVYVKVRGPKSRQP